MEIATYIPKPRFIVGVILTLLLLTLVLKAVGTTAYGQKAKEYLGLYV